ncbi:hypothetical protein FTUN_1289 [Frigoriglobus tundricola]|uniref:Uncharacterized protein n=1 Tax=Frigoriglobus tundricola TaxID=2774151 RepID=A0A6M5YIG0_9BACT|nr:hypothetical protein FTUN_1289 [Frigoriglobus tundricola]
MHPLWPKRSRSPARPRLQYATTAIDEQREANSTVGAGAA